MGNCHLTISHNWRTLWGTVTNGPRKIKERKERGATRGNKTAVIVTTARERKETDNNPGSCVRSVSGLMKIYIKKGGRDRHHLHEETKTGRTRYLHEVIFLFMPLFCPLCSISAIRFCSNVLGETRKHVSKTGVTPATSSSSPKTAVCDRSGTGP